MGDVEPPDDFPIPPEFRVGKCTFPQEQHEDLMWGVSGARKKECDCETCIQTGYNYAYRPNPYGDGFIENDCANYTPAKRILQLV